MAAVNLAPGAGIQIRLEGSGMTPQKKEHLNRDLHGDLYLPKGKGGGVRGGTSPQLAQMIGKQRPFAI